MSPSSKTKSTKSTRHSATAKASPAAAAETPATTSPEVVASTPVTTAPAVVASPVTTAPTAVASTPPLSDVVAAAAKAMSLLQQLSALIPFDDPTAKELQAAHGTSRVPDDALTIASSILSANASRFPDLDPEITKTALTYDQALGPVALVLQQLQQRTAKTVTNRRAQGVAQTLALYQMLKGLSRVSLNTATLVQQKQLEGLLKTRRKVRATSVTQAELQTAKQGMAATKKANVKAAGVATASAEAEKAAAMQAAVLGTTNGANGSAATSPSTASTAAPSAPTGGTTPAATAPAAPTTGH